MQAEATVVDAEAHPGEAHAAAPRRPTLTASEFQQLGMFQLAYLKIAAGNGDDTNIVIHGADGIAVAAVDGLDTAVELADQLGLALLSVH